MPSIPPELLPQLAQLGIDSPEVANWKRLEEWSAHYVRAHYFCPCVNGSGEKRVEMAFTWLANRKIFIGQCRWCQTVYWREAVSR